MKASVIITTYRRASFLHRAVESALQQTVECEVIIVDDNGKGTQYQLEAEKLLDQYLDRIRYFALDNNSGACVARNTGATIANGEYLFFLDDDDEFLPHKVEVQTKFLDENTKFDGCLSAFKRIEKNKKEIFSPSNWPKVGHFKDFALYGNFFTPMLAVRKSAFLETGGFRIIPRFQDRYFLLHSLLQEFSFAEIHEPLYIMYEHGGDRVTHNSVEKSIVSLDKIKELICQNVNLFNPKEYQSFLQKDYRMRATIYYLSKQHRYMAAKYWLKTWNIGKRPKDLLMMIKSFIN